MNLLEGVGWQPATSRRFLNLRPPNQGTSPVLNALCRTCPWKMVSLAIDLWRLGFSKQYCRNGRQPHILPSYQNIAFYLERNISNRLLSKMRERERERERKRERERATYQSIVATADYNPWFLLFLSQACIACRKGENRSLWSPNLVSWGPIAWIPSVNFPKWIEGRRLFCQYWETAWNQSGQYSSQEVQHFKRF